jgi:hypothetical protein
MEQKDIKYIEIFRVFPNEEEKEKHKIKKKKEKKITCPPKAVSLRPLTRSSELEKISIVFNRCENHGFVIKCIVVQEGIEKNEATDLYER